MLLLTMFTKVAIFFNCKVDYPKTRCPDGLFRISTLKTSGRPSDREEGDGCICIKRARSGLSKKG